MISPSRCSSRATNSTHPPTLRTCRCRFPPRHCRRHGSRCCPTHLTRRNRSRPRRSRRRPSPREPRSSGQVRRSTAAFVSRSGVTKKTSTGGDTGRRVAHRYSDEHCPVFDERNEAAVLSERPRIIDRIVQAVDIGETRSPLLASSAAVRGDQPGQCEQERPRAGPPYCRTNPEAKPSDPQPEPGRGTSVRGRQRARGPLAQRRDPSADGRMGCTQCHTFGRLSVKASSNASWGK